MFLDSSIAQLELEEQTPFELKVREIADFKRNYIDKDYTCPLCHELCPGGQRGLEKHFFSEKIEDICKNVERTYYTKAVCPICCSRPGGSYDYKSINIVGLLEVRHKFSGPRRYQKDINDNWTKFEGQFFCPDFAEFNKMRKLIADVQNAD